MPLNPYDAEKHHIALGASEGPRSINYLDIAPGIIMPYWYRLGEAGPWPSAATPNFARDSSGHDRHLTAQGASVSPGQPLPTTDVPGGLTSGDDGAMKFNVNYTISSSSFYPLELYGGYPNMEAPMRVGYGGTPPPAVGGGSTFCAWVAFQPPGPGDAFWPDGVASQTFAYSLVSTWIRDYGIGNEGASWGSLLRPGNFTTGLGRRTPTTGSFGRHLAGWFPESGTISLARCRGLRPTSTSGRSF